MPRSRQDWFSGGLRFACTRCGDCCRGEGYVWVDPAAIEAIARFLDMPAADVSIRFVRQIGQRLSLVEKPDHDCVFWAAESGCTIHPVRPRQCRSFPFWRSHLESREAWERAARECPGMNRGALRSARLIDELLEAP